MKKKIFMITLAACLIVLSIAGSSLAYFTDVEDATNVFTAGNVDIALTYADQAADADVSATPVEISSKAYPGQSYDCNAVISNTGTENAYVGAIITMTNGATTLSEVITLEAKDTDAIPSELKDLFTNLEKDGYTVKYAAVTGGYAIYVVKTTALAGKNGDTVDSAAIFDKVVIPKTWDNKEMKVFSGTKITVKAYATQEVGFGTATEALKAAFATDWANY